MRWFGSHSGVRPEEERTAQTVAPFSSKLSATPSGLEPPVPPSQPPTTLTELSPEPLRLILAENMRGAKPVPPLLVPALDPATVRPSGPDLTFVAPGNGERPHPGTISAPAPAPPPSETNAPILYEEPLPDAKKERPKPARTHSPSGGTSERTLGTLAVIIDDLGYDWPHSKAIAELPADVTMAILPKVPFSREIARLGKKLGKEMLLHQPMEPIRYPHTSPGPGAMLASMESERLQSVLRDNLANMPEVVGINNHMGSRLTERATAMDATMHVLLDKQLFFIDSRTSDNSVAAERATAHQVPTATRDIFLDNVAEEGAILRQLHRLERLALSHGEAIGIGHPYRATVAALQQWLPTLPGKGIRVQRVSRFLRPVQARTRFPAREANGSATAAHLSSPATDGSEPAAPTTPAASAPATTALTGD
ncbi:MAG: divergent polysaccharide deacetylase family protein [Magnetococcales bacterium]|nr:divergent polysaccharide deacetylase family protein [Magnetococcales bacterium]